MSCLTILFQSADRVKIWIQAAEAACYCHAVGADHHPGAWSWRHRSAQSRTGRRHLEPNPKHHNTGNRWEQMGTDGNRWEQMGTDGNRWEQMGTDGNRWEQMGTDGNRWEQVEGDWNSRSWDASTFKLWHPKQIQKFHVQQAAKWLQHSAHGSHRSEITTLLASSHRGILGINARKTKWCEVMKWCDKNIHWNIRVYIIYIYIIIYLYKNESDVNLFGASVELQWSFSGAVESLVLRSWGGAHWAHPSTPASTPASMPHVEPGPLQEKRRRVSTKATSAPCLTQPGLKHGKIKTFFKIT